jgi:hypothetical protein
MLRSLERKLVEHRAAALTHVDATMRLFNPTVSPKVIAAAATGPDLN